MTPENNQSESLDVLKAIAPFLVGAVALSVLISVGVLTFTASKPLLGGASVVTFDTMKYTNATRAVASTFLKLDKDAGEAGALLSNLPERVRKSIEKTAGPHTLVLLKQAVVQGQARDITVDVLKDLGLPYNVATLDDTAYSLDVAPTNLQPIIRQSAGLSGAGASEPIAAGAKVLP